jgi:hypothetical protein
LKKTTAMDIEEKVFNETTDNPWERKLERCGRSPHGTLG